MASSKAPRVTDEQLLELEFLKTQEKEELRRLSLADLWSFVNFVLWPEDSPIHYYEPLHAHLCRWVTVEDPGARRLLLMPRGHRKTYLMTIAHAVWRILRDPDIRILLVSALDDTAQQFCQAVKRQFQYNESLLAIFPEFRVPRNTQFGRTYDFTHPMRRNHNLIDPTFRSFYLGAPLAGRRCDILIADDPIEKRHVTTPDQADKALKDFNDLIPIVDKTGKYNIMCVIGTRWSYNDIYGAMLGEDRGTDQDVELQSTSRFDSIVRHCLEDADGNPDFDHGTPILPTVWSRDSLLKELDQYRMDPKRGEEDWWKQYMNICISPTGRKFEPEYFSTWIPALPGPIIFSGIAVDSATKDEQILMRGDHTVALVFHFDAYGHLYLTDGVRSDRMKGAELINELISMVQRCQQRWGLQPTNLLKEKVGEDTFFGWVRSEFNRARLPLTVFPLQVRGQGRKYVRIVEAIQHPAMARQIHFVEGFPKRLWECIVDEATHLGQWSHDDAIDALSLPFHPDTRVKATNVSPVAWNTPLNSRVMQLSTKQTTPAAAAGRMQATPQAWRVGTQPPPAERPDPFLSLRTGRKDLDIAAFTLTRPAEKEWGGQPLKIGHTTEGQKE